MRKMTKTAAVLAAMSAMTVASASMAFAAENEIKNVSSIAQNAEAEAGAVSGTWNEDSKGKWTFTVDGKKLKNTWAEIDNVWYYFDGDTVVRDRIIELDSEYYYFDESGRLATGWQKITSDMDAYSDIDISDALTSASNISSQENAAYVYNDYVWCYFDESGKAAQNEWFQSESGLWYYFEEMVMVRDLYNFTLEAKNTDYDGSSLDKTYGFDSNGAMLVGWNYKKGSTTKNDPTADAAGKTWFYYNTDGKMQTAGWKKIDGNWYLFAKENTMSNAGHQFANAYPLIVNSYVTSYPATGSNPEFFYVNDDGKMQTGVVTLPKKVNIVEFYDSSLAIDSTYSATSVETGKPEIYFGTKGAATEELVDGRYYTLSSYGDITTTKIDFDKVSKVSSSSIAVTGAATAVTSGAYNVSSANGDSYYGRVIESAFIGVNGENLYIADENGDIIKNKAVLIDDNSTSVTTDDEYVLFDRYGEAYSGYSAKDKSVTVGNKTYWSTGNTERISGVDVSVFKLNKTK